jgi:hypothetical protein
MVASWLPPVDLVPFKIYFRPVFLVSFSYLDDAQQLGCGTPRRRAPIFYEL